MSARKADTGSATPSAELVADVATCLVDLVDAHGQAAEHLRRVAAMSRAAVAALDASRTEDARYLLGAIDHMAGDCGEQAACESENAAPLAAEFNAYRRAAGVTHER